LVFEIVSSVIKNKYSMYS